MNWSILFFVFFVNGIYIALNTIRILFTTRGYRILASVIAVIEITVYTLGLSVIMEYVSKPLYLIIYALGFGVGTYIGITLEQKMALGHSVLLIIPQDNSEALTEQLREENYGVTVLTGYGKEKERNVLLTVVPIKKEKEVRELVHAFKSQTFFISLDIRYTEGGIGTSKIKKNKVDH